MLRETGVRLYLVNSWDDVGLGVRQELSQGLQAEI